MLEGALTNKYLFNDKEFQNDLNLNLYDYNKRYYDPALGKFISSDKLSAKYPWWSQYQFAGNMPTRFIDLDGLEPYEKQYVYNTGYGGPQSTRRSSSSIAVGEGNFIFVNGSDAGINDGKFNGSPRKSNSSTTNNRSISANSQTNSTNNVNFESVNKVLIEINYFNPLALMVNGIWGTFTGHDINNIEMKGLSPALSFGSGLIAFTPFKFSLNFDLATEEATQLKINPRTLQHMFTQHANDFGVTSNWSNSAATEFENVIRSHVEGLTPIKGTFRGTRQVLHFFNPNNGLDIMTDLNGNLIGGWRLDADQINNLLTKGSVK